MQPFLLMIAPVRADPDFSHKMDIVRRICKERSIDYRIPSVDPPPFDLASELTIIRKAHSIIADLSYGRPSCYYELGLVEASQKVAVIIAATGTEILQHAGHRPVTFFDDLEGYTKCVAEGLDV